MHPMPTKRFFGRRQTKGFFTVTGFSVMIAHASNALASRRSKGSVRIPFSLRRVAMDALPSTLSSRNQRNVRPAAMTVFTGFKAASGSTRIISSRAISSGARRSWTSVAVVMTGSAPTAAETSLAQAFAPPRCPESREIQCFPHSSMTSTAGSDALLTTCGAMARTAMPDAMMKRIPS